MQPGALDRKTAKQVLPFAAAALLGLLSAAIPPIPDPTLLACAAVLAAALAASPVIFAWARPPAPLSVIPPLLFLVVVVLLRDAHGGSGSGFAPLVLLSVFWVALYGVRWQLAVVLLGVAYVFLVPLLGVFHGDYAASDLRYGILWVAISALIGYTAQGLVNRQRSQRRSLTEQRDFLDAMFDSAGSLVAVLETDGRVRRINPACERVGGFSQAEMAGRPFWDFLLTKESAGETEQRWSSGPARLAGVEETVMVDRDGAEHTIHWTLTPLHDADGQVVNFVATGLDVTEQKGLERELKQMAEHDSLSGLLNRRRFEQELQRHINHVARHGHSGATLLLDVDNFKAVNDTLGHAEGDALIVAIARTLDENLRGTDEIGRVGGDEFAILLREGGPEDAVTVAEKLIRAVRGLAVVVPGGEGRVVTISVGVAPFADSEHAGPEGPMAAADLAMYEAKQGGGDGLRLAGGTRREAPARERPR